MRKFAIVAAAGAALAVSGCGSETSGEFTGEDGETGQYTVDRETGETTMSVRTDEGVSTMRAGPDVEPDLPDGWSIYPGADVVAAANIGGAQGEGAMVTMTVDASREDIIEHYRAEAEAAGYEIEIELTTAAGMVLSGEREDGARFSATASTAGEDGKSTVQLTLAAGE